MWQYEEGIDYISWRDIGGFRLQVYSRSAWIEIVLWDNVGQSLLPLGLDDLHFTNGESMEERQKAIEGYFLYWLDSLAKNTKESR